MVDPGLLNLALTLRFSSQIQVEPPKWILARLELTQALQNGMSLDSIQKGVDLVTQDRE